MMSAYYVFYEDLTPGPRTFYFTGPIHNDGAQATAMPAVGDEIEFRHRDAPDRVATQVRRRAHIKSIELVDQQVFRFTTDPVNR